MKIYFAGTTGSGSVGSVARLREQRLLEIVPYRLLSFHYIEQYEVGGDLQQKYSFLQIIKQKQKYENQNK